MNHAFIEQLGYTMSDIPDIESWFNTVYPEPILRDKRCLIGIVLCVKVKTGTEHRRFSNLPSLWQW